MPANRLAVGHALVNFRIALFHESPGLVESLKAVTCRGPMGVTRDKHPTPQILQVAARHNRGHDGFADAVATMPRIDKHMRHVRKRGAIGNHPAEARSRASLDGAEAE
jgi:hypothetical protein